MKLYSLDNSPFAARVRMQIRHKSLPVEISAPEHPPRSPEFRASYPLGRVPTLVLDDGQMIGESTAIMNYLEALYPDPPMIPSTPLALAQNEMLVRYTDTHLSIPLKPLFDECFMLMGQGRAPEQNHNRFDLLIDELEKLNSLLVTLPPFADRNLQTGDLCLVGNLYYVSELADFFGDHGMLDRFENIVAWQQWLMSYSAVAYEITVIDKAHTALLNSFQK